MKVVIQNGLLWSSDPNSPNTSNVCHLRPRSNRSYLATLLIGSEKNTMLADVIGTYVDSLTEREFDAPFIALLRLHGFTDIHFLHGSFEFGKDFIAKGIEDAVRCQYVFQTKAGNIGISDWNE